MDGIDKPQSGFNAFNALNEIINGRRSPGVVAVHRGYVALYGGQPGANVAVACFDLVNIRAKRAEMFEDKIFCLFDHDPSIHSLNKTTGNDTHASYIYITSNIRQMRDYRYIFRGLVRIALQAARGKEYAGLEITNLQNWVTALQSYDRSLNYEFAKGCPLKTRHGFAKCGS